MIAPHDFGGDAVFAVVDSQERETDVTFSLTTYYTSLENLYPRVVVEFEKYEDTRAGYMYVRTFDSILESRYEDILDFLRKIKDYEYLIIDIRGNMGGYFRSWVNGIVRPLLKEDILHEYYLAYRTGEYVQMFHEGFLSDKVEVPKETFSYLPSEVIGVDYKVFNFSDVYTATHEVIFNGRIILLTDHMVYSAAEGFTNFCKETGFATVYGTASGGDGFFQWPLYYVLPNSKLVITVTSAMSLDASGHSNEETRTQPDVYHESPFMDMDELINYVLEEIK